MRGRTATLGICILGLTTPITGGTGVKAAEKKKETAVVWSVQKGKCHDEVSNRNFCLEKSRKDRVRWGISNNCNDAALQFTLKDPEPVTNCTIMPAQPAFREAASSSSASCMRTRRRRNATTAERTTTSTIKSVKGGDEHLIRSGKPIMMSHELDIGVNP